jgi:hypothetical protein
MSCHDASIHFVLWCGLGVQNPSTKIEEKRKRWEVDWKASFDVTPFVVTTEPIVVGKSQIEAFVNFSNTKALSVKRAVLYVARPPLPCAVRALLL